mmetsp:Transcript_44262/g.42960  ORF Transcript_44262/g.42960 Transcript_44262/m.42960 type:complete len:199 (+) Transcript_44262:214-810(+)
MIKSMSNTTNILDVQVNRLYITFTISGTRNTASTDFASTEQYLFGMTYSQGYWGNWQVLCSALLYPTPPTDPSYYVQCSEAYNYDSIGTPFNETQQFYIYDNGTDITTLNCSNGATEYNNDDNTFTMSVECTRWFQSGYFEYVDENLIPVPFPSEMFPGPLNNYWTFTQAYPTDTSLTVPYDLSTTVFNYYESGSNAA